MTKADLIEEVSRLAELTRKDSEVIVETIFDSVVRSLRSGDKIEIRGFGSFRTRQRKPRVGRNPKTGARVEDRLARLEREEVQPVDVEVDAFEECVDVPFVNPFLEHLDSQLGIDVPSHRFQHVRLRPPQRAHHRTRLAIEIR